MGKIAYKVQNWSQYNQALIDRGNLTIWFCEGAVDDWYSTAPRGLGRPRIYSDKCIEIALIIRSLFHLPLRGTQGFLEGLFQLINIDLKVPHYSQLCRRAAGLGVQYYTENSDRRPKDLVVDSTGLKIYGEGEWKMRTHGKQKRRTWRKLHVAVNPDTFETVTIELTEATITDDQVMPDLLEGLHKIRNVYADGAYLSKACFDSIAATGGEAVIALRSGTGLVKKNPSPGQILRNNLVKEIWVAGGRSAWKKTSGYHKRSLAETHMYRFKTILGANLSSRKFENQVIEAQLKTLILNKMTKLGMPDTLTLVQV